VSAVIKLRTFVTGMMDQELSELPRSFIHSKITFSHQRNMLRQKFIIFWGKKNEGNDQTFKRLQSDENGV
jgi:hypothetical protein